MNVSLSEMRELRESPLREGLMTMTAQDSTFKLILCPFLSELWKCSVCTAAAGGNELYSEHGEWRLISNQPGRIYKER